MASPAMLEKFASRKAPKFSDEGPPEESGRGASAEESDVSDDAPESVPDMPGADEGAGDAAPGPEGMDPGEQAVDDLSDMLGVGPEDREGFAAALQAYVQSCIDKSGGSGMPMPPGDEMPEAEEPEPPAMGG